VVASLSLVYPGDSEISNVLKGVWAMSTDRIRYFAAAMAGVAAIFYFLIAAHVLRVVDLMDQGITTFGLIAGAGFLVAAILLAVWKRRALWIVGAVLEVIVIAIYFKVGASRTPHFETWGLVLRVPQALIFFALAYLSVRPAPARLKPVKAN
jgi:hypothetical protein